MIAIPAFALSVLISQFIGQKLADSLVYQASRTVRADFMKGFGMGLIVIQICLCKRLRR